MNAPAKKTIAAPAPPAADFVPITDWPEYKALLAARGLSLAYVGWPPGERAPVWRVVEAQGEMR